LTLELHDGPVEIAVRAGVQHRAESDDGLVEDVDTRTNARVCAGRSSGPTPRSWAHSSRLPVRITDAPE
jgi:hypothetical protein